MLLILGGTGKLGSRVVSQLKEKNELFLSPIRSELNILNINELRQYCIENKIKKILNLSGHPMFCGPELEFFEKKEQTENGMNYRMNIRETNVIGCYNIVTICDELKIRLIYTSSEYVFYGDKGLYKTNDGLCPKNIYGYTKACGEFLVRSLPDHMIIRPPLIRDDKFEHPKAFTDQFTSRQYVSDVAKQIIDNLDNKYIGIKHIVGKRQSLFDLAKETVKDVEKGTMSDNLKLVLPTDSSLDTN